MTDRSTGNGTEICTTSREQADALCPGAGRPTDAQDRAVTREEKLDEGLKDSMDASDPPSTTHPGDHGDPVPSSGYKEEDEKDEKDGAEE